MDGEVEQMLDNNATGTVFINGRNYSPVKRATTRLMPVQVKFTTQFKPVRSNWSSALSFLAVSKADDLSLKDATDITRIPSNGTQVTFWPIFMGTMIFQTAVQFRSLWKILVMLTIGYMDPV